MVTVVCIPAYNEEQTISQVVANCKKYSDYVLVCDDGSTDETTSKAKGAGAKLINHKKNLGKGAAMKSLFKSALNDNVDAIVTIDGDGQFLPEQIPQLVSPVIEKKADIVKLVITLVLEVDVH